MSDIPICRWGGAFCTAGPGAAGAAEVVDQHERTYHGKRQVPTSGKAQFRGTIVGSVPLDEADEYMRCNLSKPARRQHTRSPQAEARRSERQRQLAEERKKRGY